MLKVTENFSATIVSKIFEKQIKVYDLRNPSAFGSPKVHSVFHGKKSISYHAPQAWNMVPLKIKKLATINAFKRKLINESHKA